MPSLTTHSPKCSVCGDKMLVGPDRCVERCSSRLDVRSSIIRRGVDEYVDADFNARLRMTVDVDKIARRCDSHALSLGNSC